MNTHNNPLTQISPHSPLHLQILLNDWSAHKTSVYLISQACHYTRRCYRGYDNWNWISIFKLSEVFIVCWGRMSPQSGVWNQEVMIKWGNGCPRAFNFQPIWAFVPNNVYFKSFFLGVVVLFLSSFYQQSDYFQHPLLGHYIIPLQIFSRVIL